MMMYETAQTEIRAAGATQGYETPALSVIITTGEDETLLQATLQSVLDQTFRNMEVICVFSGDHARMAQPAQADQRVRTIVRPACVGQMEEAAGRAQAGAHSEGMLCNAGLDEASGEFVLFLHAGDLAPVYAYEVLINKAVKYEADVLRFPVLSTTDHPAVYAGSHDLALRGAFWLSDADRMAPLRSGDYHRPLDLKDASPVYAMSNDPAGALYRRGYLSAHAIRFPQMPYGDGSRFLWEAMLQGGRIIAVRDPARIRGVCSERPEGFTCACPQTYLDGKLQETEYLAALTANGRFSQEEKRTILPHLFQTLFDSIQPLWESAAERADREPAGEDAGTEPSMDDPAAEEAGPAPKQLCKEALQAQLAHFVKEYAGEYAFLLREAYRTFLKQTARAAKKTVTKKPAPFYKKKRLHPNVSVILPVYNVENYLNEALHSLYMQSMPELEIICVNDGSTDGSLAIMKEYAAFDRRIVILDGPNGGYGKAMNRGIDAAKSPYMGILEPDDYVSADMFRDLYDAALRYDADMVKSDFIQFTVGPDGTENEKIVKIGGDASWYQRVFCPSDEWNTFQSRKNTWTGIYRMELIRRYRIRHNETPGASYQNNGFWFQTFCLSKRTVFLNQPYYHYRWDNPDSSMHHPGKMYAVTEEFRFIEDFIRSLPQTDARYEDAVRMEHLYSVFYAQKFNAMLVTYRRLAQELKQEYVHHIADALKDPLSRGEIAQQDMMSAAQWKILHEMTADPDGFFNHICVSVVMPVYNASEYLRETMDTLLERSEIRFEVICVDDGSTDDSLSILREYEAADPRVRVIAQANGGAGTARNHGLKYAKGEYLVFLDADDFFEPDLLRRAYDQAHTLETDVTVFRSDRYVQETGKYISSRHTIRMGLLPPQRPFAAADVPVNLFRAFMMWPWDKMYRADFVRENHLAFQEVRIANDLRFVFSCIAKADRISTLNSVLVHHRKYEGSLSGARAENWPCYYEALDGLRSQLMQWGLYERFEQDFINYSLYFCLWTLTTTSGDAYRQLYAKLKNEWLRDLKITEHGADYFYEPREYAQLEQLLENEPEDFLHLCYAASQEQYDTLRRMKRDEISVLKADNAAVRKRNRGLLEDRRALRQEKKETLAKQKDLEESLRVMQEAQHAMEKEMAQVRRANAQLKQEIGTLSGQIRVLTGEKQELEESKKEQNALCAELRDELRDEKRSNKKLRTEKKRLQAQIDRMRASAAWKIGRALTWLPRKLRGIFA